MVAYASVAPNTVTTQIPIETMRGVAIVLLVSYHVIGSTQNSGLAIGYPEMLRLFADFFIDVRMPFFAFIAGFVYAIRPPSASTYLRFMTGKFTRLFVPCIFASSLFAVIAVITGSKFAPSFSEMALLPFVSYAHFWFLQSILVIFAAYGLFDAFAGRRFACVVLLSSAVVYLSPLSAQATFMSVNGAIYLFPYFMLGVVLNRYGTQIWFDAERLSLLLLCVVVVCALWNIKILYETGSFSTVRRDLQSIGFGTAICVLTFLSAPRLPLLEKLSPYGFTIYLYHVFGTVAAREACDVLNVASAELRFAVGLVAGLLFPIALHRGLERVPVLDQILLGRSLRSEGRRALRNA